jgi:two-component system, LytTR family, response regulator
MLTAILIDDEKGCLDTLEIELQAYCSDVNVLAKCQSAEKALEVLETLVPDMIFLDISMPQINGFDFLLKIPKINFEIIFCTAYDAFALTAFDFCAIDYLLKPISKEKLIRAVDKVRQKQHKQVDLQNLDLLLANMRGGINHKTNIAVPTAEGLEFITITDIIYAEADGNYSRIYMTNKEKILISRTLKDLEALLSNNPFVRIHQSYLVNLAYIKKYVKGEGGYVIMNNGTSLQVSRANRIKLMDLVR